LSLIRRPNSRSFCILLGERSRLPGWRRETREGRRCGSAHRAHVLKVVDAPVSEPVQGEELIKVKAASINPGEAKIREGFLRDFRRRFRRPLLVSQGGRAQQKFRYAPYVEFLRNPFAAAGEVGKQGAESRHR
jgi:hypothetical protein